MPPRSAIDALLDQVDWRCASCGTSMRVGCHCLDRTTPAQKQAIADTVRAQFRVLLKAQCPVVWASRSARTSLSTHVWNTVQRLVRALDQESHGPAPLTPAEAREMAALVHADVDGYWQWQYPELYASVAPGFLARLWRDVEIQMCATLEAFHV